MGKKKKEGDKNKTVIDLKPGMEIQIGEYGPRKKETPIVIYIDILSKYIEVYNEDPENPLQCEYLLLRGERGGENVKVVFENN